MDKEIRNELIDKIIQQYELDSKDIADCVELFYDCQELRIRHANRERTEGPGQLVSWLAKWLQLGEKVIGSKLLNWVNSDKSPEECKWAFDQVGIGPIIASGLAAHIDVTKAPCISSLWKFSGCAPGFDRKVKGKTLPYNARLKVLIWKLGQSFCKVSGKEDATYGQYYRVFKDREIQKNDEGLYKEAAARELTTKKFRPDTVTLKRLEQGKLSDAHLHARACRKTAKLFLSHYWLIARKSRGLPISDPYSIAILKHGHRIDPK